MDHNKALMRNLFTSLVLHDQIKTTEKKAKLLASLANSVISRARDKDLMNAIRYVDQYVFTKEANKRFFSDVLPRLKDQSTGYVRIVRLGNRMGDNAKLVHVEFVS